MAETTETGTARRPFIVRLKQGSASSPMAFSRVFSFLKTTSAPRTEGHGAPADSMVTQPSPSAPGDELSSQVSDEKQPESLDDSPEKLGQPDPACRSLAPPEDHPARIIPLPKPVVIPRLNPGSTFPFARAWAPELEQQGISQTEWLEFLDRLNIVCSPHPGITATHIISIGLAFAPLEGADGLAALVELGAAGLTTYMARAKCQKLLARMNHEVFGPRGLHARIVCGKELRRNLIMQEDDPLTAPLREETLDMTAQQRCLEHLKDRVCELEFDVPGPEPQTKALARLAAWRVRQHVKDTDKNAKRARKRAWKRFQKGKKLKEGREERSRVKRISWVLLQNIEDFEKDRVIEEEMKANGKGATDWRGLFVCRRADRGISS